jgi:hypothetical protein
MSSRKQGIAGPRATVVPFQVKPRLSWNAGLPAALAEQSLH